MANTIKFDDPETGKEIEAEITSRVHVNGQTWGYAQVNGVRWAIPDGWPNNASPICQESEPEAFAEIFG